jgi:hypothetical protein
MEFENLTNILPPPVEIFNSGTEKEWKYFEDRLGTSLPIDYKEFVNSYGSGAIDNFLWVLNPFIQNENLNLFLKTKVICEAYVQSKRKFPHEFLYDVYPEVGGLLPWALTDNGDVLYWITKGEHESWQIVVFESRSTLCTSYNKSMTEFIYEIVSHNLKCTIFPDDFPSDTPEFISVDI